MLFDVNTRTNPTHPPFSLRSPSSQVPFAATFVFWIVLLIWQDLKKPKGLMRLEPGVSGLLISVGELGGFCPLGSSPTPFGLGLFHFGDRHLLCDRRARSTCRGCSIDVDPFAHWRRDQNGTTFPKSSSFGGIGESKRDVEYLYKAEYIGYGNTYVAQMKATCQEGEVPPKGLHNLPTSSAAPQDH